MSGSDRCRWLRLGQCTLRIEAGEACRDRFCVTGGHKFGGDFLAYEGDPCLFHARCALLSGLRRRWHALH